MKATLSFSLPEEDEEYLGAVKGPRLRSACGEFAEWMRRRQKDDTALNLGCDEIDAVKNKCWETVGPHLEE